MNKSMQTEKKQLSLLIPPKKNVRIHSQKQIAEFIRSIQMFGQIRPIVIDEANVILCGNGLYEAMLKMGQKEADVLIMQNLSDNQKKKLMIADNKIYGLGIDNLESLNSYFYELKDDLDIPGFDEDILKSMIEEADEITSRISDYGIIPDEVIADMKKNAENRTDSINNSHERQNDNRAIAESEKKRSNENAICVNSDNYILCPNCGEKIWL